MFIYDYRGYGCSTGKADKKGIVIDAISCWNYIIDNLQVSPNKIILFGHSLGTTVSTQLLNHIVNSSHDDDQYLPRALILQNPFSSLRRLIGDMFPFMGKVVGRLIFNHHSTDQYLHSIDQKLSGFPILIMHAKHDRMISISHSQDLHRLIRNNKSQFIELGGDHERVEYPDEVDHTLSNFVINIEIK